MKHLIAALLSLCALPVTAQIPVLHPEPDIAEIPAGYLCYLVDSRRGWQRIDTSALSSPTTFAFGPENWRLQRDMGIGPMPGWTVDAAKYDRVGPSGHSGFAAEELAPFNAYKFDQKWPFGALIMRTEQGDRYHVKTSATAKSLSEHTRYLDMRINDGDNALGDNAGEVMVCIKDLALFN
ncbi:MAG: hypothetical protein ACSHWS_06715 [Sulfitobacter sp.]